MSNDIALQNALSQPQVGATGSNRTGSGNPESATAGLAEDFNDFLSLLTTQLQNQDPTEPMSTEEFTNQLVQFSQVEQSINTNTKLDELISLQTVDPFTSATGFVGLTASFEGSEFFFDGEKPAQLSYSLNDSAQDTTITVTDQFGGEVFSTSGKTSPGAHEFTWDGTDNAGNPVPQGTYAVEVESVDSDGNDITSATLVKGEVHGIESDGTNTFLLIGERAVPQSQILRLEQPATQTQGQTEEEDNQT